MCNLLGGCPYVVVPATQRDVWVWLCAASYSTVLTSAVKVTRMFDSVATLAHEQHCFVLQDSRTWEGFIDGTENPGPFQAPEAAFVADGQKGAGGTTALIQCWVNAPEKAFEALSTEEQVSPPIRAESRACLTECSESMAARIRRLMHSLSTRRLSQVRRTSFRRSTLSSRPVLRQATPGSPGQPLVSWCRTRQQ